MRNFIETFNKTIRALSQDEIIRISKFFPNADLNNIKFLDNEFMELDYSENLCFGVESSCINKGREIDVYLNLSNRFLENIKTHEIEQEICTKSKFRCEDSYALEIQYNCIGFAMGVMVESNSDFITGNTPQEAITSFIKQNNETFPSERSINSFKILHQLQYVENISEPIKNNTVAFYFKDGICKHAARYITDFDFWVSKLGPYILIGHTLLEDLVGETYGNRIYYAEVIEMAGEDCSNF